MPVTLSLQSTASFIRHASLLALFVACSWLVAGCGGREPEAATGLALPPTWTPTPYQSPTPAPPSPTPTPLPTDTPVPEPTATPMPRVAVLAAQTALRAGPGEEYEQVGSVKEGTEFLLLARDESGAWWQIRVNQQPVWVAAADVEARHTETVAVALDIPTPPPTPTPEPPTPTPLPPPPTPLPPPTNTPVPAAPDPCANIGGDGCKFKVRGGPAFTPNGGTELKLTFAFIHSGRNNEAQGSYFVWLEKDGVKLPVPDSVRSWTGEMRQGPHGAYNYENKVGLGELPGNNVAGCYTGWVLDGNGERDSQNFTFCVPEGQGEVWIQFDQA